MGLSFGLVAEGMGLKVVLALPLLLVWTAHIASAESNYYQICHRPDMKLGRSTSRCLPYNSSAGASGSAPPGSEHFIAVDVMQRSPCHGRLLLWSMPVSRACLLRMIILRMRDSSEHAEQPTASPQHPSPASPTLVEYVEVSSVTGYLVPDPDGHADLSLAQEEVEIFIEPSDIFAFSTLSPHRCQCFASSRELGKVWTSARRVVTLEDETHWLKPEQQQMSWSITFDTTASFPSDLQQLYRAKSNTVSTRTNTNTNPTQPTEITRGQQADSHLVEVADFGGFHPLRLLVDMSLLGTGLPFSAAPLQPSDSSSTSTHNVPAEQDKSIPTPTPVNSEYSADGLMNTTRANPMNSSSEASSGKANNNYVTAAAPAIAVGATICLLLVAAIWRLRKPREIRLSPTTCMGLPKKGFSISHYVPHDHLWPYYEITCVNVQHFSLRLVGLALNEITEHVYDLPDSSLRPLPTNSLYPNQVLQPAADNQVTVHFLADGKTLKTHMYAILEKEITYAVPSRKQRTEAKLAGENEEQIDNSFDDTGSLSSDATTPELPRRGSGLFYHDSTDV